MIETFVRASTDGKKLAEKLAGVEREKIDQIQRI